MKTKKFFANAASKALALAAVVMMSLAFAACGSDNNDDGGGKTPDTPLPLPTAGTVTFDGKEKSIVSAEYKDETGGDYSLYLYLSADRQEKVRIILNKDVHMTGNPVNLSEKEKEHDGEYWIIDYYDADGNHIIDTWGNPGSSYPIFDTGTLTVSGDPTGTLNIKLENGRVMGEDGKEHTLTISYGGKMEKYGAPLPTPKAQTVTLDGEEKPILKAEYKDWGSGNYILYLYLSADGKERVKLELNKDLHMSGSPVDLTKKEAEHAGFNWGIDYYDADGTTLIYTFGDPGNEAPVFTTGGFTASGSPESTISIKLENGRVKGTDDKEHTLTLSYSGKMTKK